jgi:molecular chaperone GrpE
MPSQDDDRKPSGAPETEAPPPDPMPAVPEPEVSEPPAAGAEAKPEESEPARRGRKRLAEELEEARAEAALLKDRYLRTAAEMENQRKRLDRERSEYLQFGLSDLLKELLTVVDNFERAIAAGGEAGPESFRAGIGLIHKQMLDLLRKRGVTPVEAESDLFDPAFQQAIVTEESAETDEPRVAEELQRGYRLHDRLLRPALVRVLVPSKRD